MNIFKVTKVPVMLLAVAMLVGACGNENSAKYSEKSISAAIEKTNKELKKDSQKMQAYADDATVTSKVNAAILAEPGMKVLDINVETNVGVATLEGTVDSSESKDRAEELVASVDGVKRVNNKLVVENAEYQN